jgi:chemotaxis protein methyltransferase CheR
MDESDFTYLADFLRHRSGLVLTSQKPDFAENRLAPVMRCFGFKSLPALIAELREGHEALAQAVAEAVTVGDSSFFRDRKVFEEFAGRVLPGIIARRAEKKRLRIWCAAAATGQEPYSVAMLLSDVDLVAAGWSIDLIASDIDPRAIDRAAEGLYSPFEIQRGLSPRRLASYFSQEEEYWRISESLRRMVSFRVFNLLDSLGWLWQIDVVLCRNVLMYFDRKTRAGVLDRISDILAPDGTLIVGINEIVPQHAGFVAEGGAPGFYERPKPAPARRMATG